MKKTNKILAFLLALMMISSFFSMSVVMANAASSGSCGENLTWSYNTYTKTLTISGTGEMDTFRINNFPWESFKDEMVNVVINYGVTDITNWAFYDCKNVVSVTIPDSVTTIGSDAFAYCSSLASLTIPDSVITIADFAFSNSHNLATVTIGEGVKNIDHWAFAYCNIKNISVDENNPYYCNDEYGVLFNKDKTTLVKYTSGSERDNYIVPNGVTSIESCAFGGSNYLQNLTLPDGLTVISSYCFSNSINLKKINIPDTVTTIGRSAFSSCYNLESLTIPDSVITIEENAFNYADVTYITVAENNPNYTNDEYGVLFNKDKTILIKYSAGSHTQDYKIPDSVTTIESHAFSSSNNLLSVTIPDSVSSIGKYVFSNCTKLKSIIIPETIQSIDLWAFKYSENISDVYFYGSQDQWNQIKIDDGNEVLLYTRFHYNYYNHYVTSNITAPTCTKSGYTTNTCSCGYTYTDSYVLATGHTAVTDEKVAATCTTEGRTEGSHCAMCGIIITPQKTIPTAGHESSNWITDKKATVNASGEKHKECNVCGKILKTAVIPQLKPGVPNVSRASNIASGVKVTWSKVTGADNYIVYRRTYDAKVKKWGGWLRLATGVTSTSYLDKTAKTGTYYIYTVKANNEAGYGGHTSGLKTYFIATPKITSTANTNSAITVKWGKVSGATGYYVYRKTTGEWTKLGKTTGTSFTDKTAKSGVTYRYTIKAYYGSYVSSYNTNGTAIRRLTTPKLTKVTSAKSGVTFTWDKVTGATGYIVYRKTGSGSWQQLATIKGNAKITYLDKTAKKGTTYTYTVKAYYGSSKSAHNKGLTITDKY